MNGLHNWWVLCKTITNHCSGQFFRFVQNASFFANQWKKNTAHCSLALWHLGQIWKKCINVMNFSQWFCPKISDNPTHHIKMTAPFLSIAKTNPTWKQKVLFLIKVTSGNCSSLYRWLSQQTCCGHPVHHHDLFKSNKTQMERKQRKSCLNLATNQNFWNLPHREITEKYDSVLQNVCSFLENKTGFHVL